MGSQEESTLNDPYHNEAKLVLYYEFEKRGLYDGWYADFKFLQEAIRRESEWKINAFNTNYHKDGSISHDYGICQINDMSWDDRAEELNLNYKENWKDNLNMCAEVMYKQGRGAWVSMRYK